MENPKIILFLSRSQTMAEFCKDCFKKYLLSSEDRERIKDENIIMFLTKDLCEGCGEIKSVVDYVIWEED